MHVRPGSLRVSEWICLGYFAWITVLAVVVGAPARRGWLLFLLNAAAAAGIFLLRTAGPVVRDWVPLALLLTGYYEAGRLTFPRADHLFEKALLRWERRLLGPASNRKPGGRMEPILEFFYLQCYSIVPLGIGLLELTHNARFADYYWSNVLGSAFVAYGLTPLFPALPPRKLPESGKEPKRSALRKFSLWVSDHASIKVNSFPSGHAAAAAGATLAMMRILPAAGVCYVVVTLGILVASVKGKYHYAVDAVTGVVVALGVWIVLSR